jgi:hypothetical protein
MGRCCVILQEVVEVFHDMFKTQAMLLGWTSISGASLILQSITDFIERILEALFIVNPFAAPLTF